MDIMYLGQTAVRLKGREVTILADPPGDAEAAAKSGADIITFSKRSAQGTAVTPVGGARVVDGPGEYEISEVLIAGVSTESRPGEGPGNTAYVVRLDDLTVCHLGHARAKLNDAQVEEIGDIHVLLLPVGGDGALSPATAAEVVAQLEPSVVVPMADGTNGADGDPLEHFIREMGKKDMEPEPRLSVTRSSLPSEVRVVVLQAKSA